MTHDSALNQLICEKAAAYFEEHNVFIARNYITEDLIIEPISNISIVFAKSLYVAEAIRGLNQGWAKFEIDVLLPE